MCKTDDFHHPLLRCRDMKYTQQLSLVKLLIQFLGRPLVKKPALILSGIVSFWLISISGAQAEIHGTVVDPKNKKKVIICHVPPGNPENAHTISISKNALHTHLTHHPDYDGPCEPTVSGSEGNGTLRYADSGAGKHKDRILFMDWKDSSLEDGIQNGDIVEFDIPESSCLANGTLTATFSNVDDPNRVAQHTVPKDMKTWVGSGFYKLYDTPGSGEAIYTTEYMLKSGQTETNLGFTIDWSMQVDGESVAPDIFLIDAESTTDTSEQIDVTTNGGYWSVVENAQSTLYEVHGLGTQQVNIANTEHPLPMNSEGWSPLMLSKGMTQTTVNIRNFDASPGKEGVAFALLAPCDRGDAPETYGDAGHAFKEDALSHFKDELGLKFEPGTPYIGDTPPDSESLTQGSLDAQGDDSHTDYYDNARHDDEDDLVMPQFPVSGSEALTVPVTGAGLLQAWFDWNADGDFLDEQEQVATDVSANGGEISLNVTVPADAKIGTSFARFRYSTQPGLGATGPAKDGEVEDHLIEIVKANACSINDVAGAVYSTASLSVNSAYLTEETRIYQARFHNDNWEGDLLAYSLKTDESDGNVKSIIWNAADKIAFNGRAVFTYDPTRNTDRGREFSWAKLNAEQKTHLRQDGNAAEAKKRIDWVLGDDQHEGGLFRERDKLLGDIIHSNMAYSDPYANYGYKQLSGSEGHHYATYLRDKRDRKAALFVGANDGMLHAFDAQNGRELFAFIPDAVIPKLATLSDPHYGCTDSEDCLEHEYTVDGAISLGDAYIDTGSGNDWHNILIGTLGKGGRGLFALDVTAPESFDEENVLWEISHTQTPDSDPSNKILYANYLGYTVPASSVVRMQNGRWAAIVSNGYESASQQAVLFIIDVESGDLIKAINTYSGSKDNPNGLSTATAVDANGDSLVDVIYAGDLLGNLWAFDVSSDDENYWVSSYGTVASPEPLFRACEDIACTLPQAITAKPEVGRNPQGGLMVYVGTGKYFDVADNLVQGERVAVNTFYGIRDNGYPVGSRSDLVEQRILAEIAIDSDLISRVTTQNEVDYGSRAGWFMDFVTPPNDQAEGERVISKALLREGKLIFTTMTPPQNDCTWGGKSWIMELNAVDGSRLDTIPFDTNDDKAFTIEDNVEFEGKSTIISGLHKPSLGVIFSSPVIISHTTRSEGKYVTGTAGNVGMFREAASRFSGRMSWRRIR